MKRHALANPPGDWTTTAAPLLNRRMPASTSSLLACNDVSSAEARCQPLACAQFDSVVRASQAQAAAGTDYFAIGEDLRWN
jgi:hypothetical protein